MKVQLVNKSLNKVVLKPVLEFRDTEEAMGQYIASLLLVGIIKDVDRDIVWTGDNSFQVTTKGWEIEASLVA